MHQTIAVVAGFLLIAPGLALALQLDIERADAKRRTRDALRSRRDRLRNRSWVYVPPRKPTLAEQLQELADRVQAFQRAVVQAFQPALEQAATALQQAFQGRR